MDEFNIDRPIAPRLEHSPRARRYAFWIGLLTVFAFTGCFLEFALLESMAKPSSERVNNGRRPTFFAVHANPYYTVSEDFHLYVVRSKRILDRGWTDSLLYRREEAKASFAQPLQVGLMMLAVATDGRPIPYSLFMFGVLSVAWGVFYVTAFNCMPPSFSPITPVIATVVTMLFESIPLLNYPVSEYGQWPPHRGTRMATLAWSAPLTMALIVAATSLVFRPQRPARRIAAVGLLLLALAAGDAWSLMFSLASIAVLLVVLGLWWIVDARRRVERQPAIAVGLALLCLAGLALAVQQATTGLSGDALTRAGFGPQWRQSPIRVGAGGDLWRMTRHDLQWLATLALASGVYVTLRMARTRGGLRCRLVWRRPTRTRLHLLTLAMLSVMAVVLLIIAFWQFGAEGYHVFQFLWRREYLVLFTYIALMCEIVKRIIRSVAADRLRSAKLEIGGAVALLAALLVYHHVRVHKYISRHAAYEFFLTEDEERLGDWLQAEDKRLGRYTLATASHELNYLCAYWTDADLLLPEGFPYHNVSSDDEIAERTARLLAAFGSTPRRWTAFVLNHHPSDQWIWIRSRLLSARCGYLYYLLHRGLLLQGTSGIVPPSVGSGTMRLSQRIHADVTNIQLKLFERARRGDDLLSMVAAHLTRHPALSAQERPDVMIIDEVSRTLGTPNLDGYVREFQHGELEAWVLANRRSAPVSP